MKRLSKRNKHVWYCMIKPKTEPKTEPKKTDVA
jgi:hypothetical protein